MVLTLTGPWVGREMPMFIPREMYWISPIAINPLNEDWRFGIRPNGKGFHWKTF